MTKMYMRGGVYYGTAEDMIDRIEELETKLAKALALLESLDNQVVWESLGLGNDMADRVEATIAELKGEK